MVFKSAIIASNTAKEKGNKLRFQNFFHECSLTKSEWMPTSELMFFSSLLWNLTATVEKVAVLCRFLDIHSVTKNHLLKYSLAHAFCCFLTAVEDVNPAVATRAGLLLDTIKRPALQVG